MGKTWILRTETKGTGATMVPLETVTERVSEPEPVRVIRKAKPPAPMPAEPRAPRRFRVADVISRRNLVDDASAAEAIDALRAVRSIVDVNVYVWQPDRERWRLLTFSEQRAMFDFAAGHTAAAFLGHRAARSNRAKRRRPRRDRADRRSDQGIQPLPRGKEPARTFA